MAKLTLKDITSGFLATQTINDNNALIEALVETFLSRDGLAPNTMEATLDMNSNRVINTTDPVNLQDVATKNYVDAILASGIADQGGNAGLFLTTDGSTTSWADPLPDQTGQAGNFLTTDGSAASWAGGAFLPTLIANRLVTNDGATASWSLDFLLTTNTLAADDAAGSAFLNQAVSATTPGWVPNKTALTTGWGAQAAGNISAIIAGAEEMRFTANGMEAANAAGPAVLNEAVSTSNPTIVPNKANLITGLGWTSPNSLELIAGGATQMRIDAVANITNTTFRANTAQGPAFLNSTSSATVPTLIPNRANLLSGLGGVAGTPTIIGNSLPIATFTSIPSSVNYLGFVNAITGFGPSITPVGSDANIDLGITTVGTGLLSLTAGAGAGGNDGGAIAVTAGQGDGVGLGGDIDIDAGDGGTTGDGGFVNLRAGNATGTAGFGGDALVSAGTGSGTDDGGRSRLLGGTGGSGGGSGGDAIVQAGNGILAGIGGDIQVNAGNGGATNANGGTILIDTGDGGGASGNSGNLTLRIGAANGTQGDFKFIKTGDTVTIGHIWTASATDGTGYWAVAGTGDSVADADADTQIQVEESADEDIIRFDVGDSPTGFGAVANIMTLASSGWTVNMGTATGTDETGAKIDFTAGVGGPSNGQGGDIEFDAGLGDGTGGGGGVTIRGGNGGHTAGEGGAVFMQGGIGGTGAGGDGGAITLRGGSGLNAGQGGNATLQAGNSGTSPGLPGSTFVRGGSPASAAANSGAVTIGSLAGGATSGNSGDVTIETGTAGGTVGSIFFDIAGTTRIDIDPTGIGFFGATPVGQSSAYTRNATVVEDRTLLASASATTINNNNVLAALIADLQAIGILG